MLSNSSGADAAVVAEEGGGLLISGKGGHSNLYLLNRHLTAAVAVVFFIISLCICFHSGRGSVDCCRIGFDEIFAVVLRAAADTPENIQPGSRGCVGVDVDYLAALDILE